MSERYDEVVPERDYPMSGAPTGPVGGTYHGLEGTEVIVAPAATVDEQSFGSGEPDSTADLAKDQAGAVGQQAKESGQQVASTAKEQAKSVVSEAGSQASNLLDQARSEASAQASTQQDRLASWLHSVAEELHTMVEGNASGASSGPAAGFVTDLASQASHRTRGLASWLERRDPSAVVDEVSSFARRRPGAFLALAAGVGLLAGRLTRGLSASSSSSSGPASDTRAPVGQGGPTAPVQPSHLTGSAYGTAPLPSRSFQEDIAGAPVTHVDPWSAPGELGDADDLSARQTAGGLHYGQRPEGV